MLFVEEALIVLLADVYNGYAKEYDAQEGHSDASPYQRCFLLDVIAKEPEERHSLEYGCRFFKFYL